jgi:hypothetical protein
MDTLDSLLQTADLFIAIIEGRAEESGALAATRRHFHLTSGLILASNKSMRRALPYLSDFEYAFVVAKDTSALKKPRLFGNATLIEAADIIHSAEKIVQGVNALLEYRLSPAQV